MPFTGLARAAAFCAAFLASTPAFALPERIALLLPQSGRMAKAAETIRDGFLAAYYQDISQGIAQNSASPSAPVLDFYDSDNGNILALVQQARANGATLIVGPLDRERVEALVQAGPSPVPILALNNIEPGAAQIYQFALSPEDEVQRLAARMESQKISRPLILRATDDASLRQQRLFQAAWQQRHAQPLTVASLDASRKGGLVVSVREALANNMNNKGQHDALFLASPTLASQVLPALLYYKSRLPLFSLSSAWTPTPDGSSQRDLEGLRFCDLPWLLDAPRPEQTALYQSFSPPASSYDRLYAFGADAWTLAREWSALTDGEPLKLRSGQVQADSTWHLRRIPTCAEVRNGIATPLWTPDDSLDGSAGGGRRTILP